MRSPSVSGPTAAAPSCDRVDLTDEEDAGAFIQEATPSSAGSTSS